MCTIEAWLKKNHIADVECIIPDLTGMARGKKIPTSKYLSEKPRLPEGTLLQDVRGDFCAEYFDLIASEDKDMLLVADESTIRQIPWLDKPTAQVIHDCYTMEGDLHPLSSRNVLKRVLAEYENCGLEALAAAEVEFYLVQKNTDPSLELQPPVTRSGRTERIRQPYGIETLTDYQPIFDTLYRYCDVQHLSIDTLVHELGPAQMEINFLHGDPLAMADQVFMFKRTMREVALQHGVYATFMAKPFADEPGSSMHIHQSVIDKKTGKNIFSAEDGTKTEQFYYFLGGLQHHTQDLLALYAPNVNSYRRFTKEQGAPINLHWSYDNRTVGIRVPNATVAATRIENRFAGIDCNPYLAIATSLACGLVGIKNKIKPDQAFEGCAYEEKSDNKSVNNRSIETDLGQALSNLERKDAVHSIIGEKFIQAYRYVKLEEREQFNRIITPWEREFLLLNV